VATYQAISAVSQTIVGLLQNSLPAADFPNTTVKLCQPNEYRNKPVTTDGLTLLLYRVAVNTAQRNSMSRVRPDGTRYRLALPVDLYYLLTAWATNPEQQHRLLGWAMRTLEDNPEFPSTLLDHYRPDENTPIFKPNEAVQMTYDLLNIQDLGVIMEIFKSQGQPPQLSVTYLVRTVNLESIEDSNQFANVQTRGFDLAVPESK
jgi:hypothetical protein